VLNFAAREATAAAEKAAIGRAAAELVAEDETVVLDAGTTTFQVARALGGRSLQVVTNSLPIANVLASEARIELVFVGGFIYPRTGAALGPLANEVLARVHANKAVMGCAGINEDGLYNANTLMVESQRRMVEAADEVIVVADHTKFGKRALARLMDLSEIDRLVTDAEPDAAWRRRFDDHGVQVIVAAAPENAGRARQEVTA
jgi:DeoR/GlpR family transcriptional regulator of sugar metabolism